MQGPLNVPDGRVLSTAQTAPGPWLIRLERPCEGVQCRRCGREIRDLHGWDAAVRLRHLPLFDVPVVVEMRPKRYRCPSGSGTPPPPPCAWDEPRRPNTTA